MKHNSIIDRLSRTDDIHKRLKSELGWIEHSLWELLYDEVKAPLRDRVNFQLASRFWSLVYNRLDSLETLKIISK
jgi:hypothetical protein